MSWLGIVLYKAVPWTKTKPTQLFEIFEWRKSSFTYSVENEKYFFFLKKKKLNVNRYLLCLVCNFLSCC